MLEDMLDHHVTCHDDGLSQRNIFVWDNDPHTIYSLHSQNVGQTKHCSFLSEYLNKWSGAVCQLVLYSYTR